MTCFKLIIDGGSEVCLHNDRLLNQINFHYQCHSQIERQHRTFPILIVHVQLNLDVGELNESSTVLDQLNLKVKYIFLIVNLLIMSN